MTLKRKHCPSYVVSYSPKKQCSVCFCLSGDARVFGYFFNEFDYLPLGIGEP
jgi:hypothetical protein